MNKKKVNIDSTEPINTIADVDRMVDAFVKRGGYITLEEDLKIRINQRDRFLIEF